MNNDFTYIEHGLYYRQIKVCLDYFPKKQLLVLDYDELLKQQENLVKKVFSFWGVDESFKPEFASRNITGEIKNQWLQEKLIKQSKLKKFVVKYFIDFWIPRSKRKTLKKKMFEMNTGKKEQTKIYKRLRSNLHNILSKIPKNWTNCLVQHSRRNGLQQ